MQKLFSAVNRSHEYIGTTEIVKLMDRADAISGNVQLIRDNYETLKKICVKIINLARKNEEWFAFFGCAKGFLWLLMVNDEIKMMIKYSELLYVGWFDDMPPYNEGRLKYVGFYSEDNNMNYADKE